LKIDTKVENWIIFKFEIKRKDCVLKNKNKGKINVCYQIN